jgi:hypothetical protein
MNSSSSSSFKICTILGDKIDQNDDGLEELANPFFQSNFDQKSALAQFMATNLAICFNRQNSFHPTFCPNLFPSHRPNYSIFPTFPLQLTSNNLNSFQTVESIALESELIHWEYLNLNSFK